MIIDDFFNEKLVDLPYHHTLKAYVVSVCKQYLTTQNDLSDRSLTLSYIEARTHNDFQRFQSVADWSFWTAVFRHKVFEEHESVYETVAKCSYYSCYRLLRKQWPIFEQLADEFNQITEQTRQKMVVIPQIIVIN